jgi:hypothetical protein
MPLMNYRIDLNERFLLIEQVWAVSFIKGSSVVSPTLTDILKMRVLKHERLTVGKTDTTVFAPMIDLCVPRVCRA